MKTPPRLYLGTMTFAWSQTSSRVDERIAADMVSHFVAHCHDNFAVHGHQPPDSILAQSKLPLLPVHIDTARIYAGGKTEPCVAQAVGSERTKQSSYRAAMGDGTAEVVFCVGTKAHPSQSGGLSPAGIESQFRASAQAMKVNVKVDPFTEYYLHQPDPNHSLLESLQCLHEYCEQGKISAIGMSNYHVSEMARAFELCRTHNLTPPTVYQGLYNPLNRLVEDELLPLLHQNNCAFVAYNPLAAGLLAGKYSASDMTDVPKGRFRKNPNYLPRFFTDANFAAVECIRTACEATGMTMIEATYRWLQCHSGLDGDNLDGILLGASSLSQLEENLQACTVGAEECAERHGPLPKPILDAFDQAWGLTKEAGVFPYWRSYSSDHPNRESLDQGASYSAAKK